MRESWEDCAYTALIVFCFLIRGEEILLIRRANEPYKGETTIPGGRKKRGESLRAACAREMLEETGLILGEMSFAGVLHAWRDGDPMEYVSHYYVCHDFKGELCPSDEGELLWARLDESLELPGIHPFYQRILPYIRCGEVFDLSVTL
ncbi:MAG: NUDIX domain-containing protein [Fretibacterium sp.]|nr:NUDIX domain-containing protein [Fretibacterium sp.]